jgi:hypothetical protein
MKPGLGRLAESLLVAAIRRSTSQWAEALVAEASELPSAWQRWCWLAGGIRLMAFETHLMRRLRYGGLALAVLVLPLFFRFGVVAFVVAAVLVGVAVGAVARPFRAAAADPEVTVSWATPVRVGICAGVVAVIALTIVTVIRYPHAAEGKGGPLFTAILAILLAAYATASFRVTAAGSSARSAAVRYGTLAGLAGGVLFAAGTPAGARYQVDPVWADVGYTVALVVAFVAPALVAGGLAARVTGRLEAGLLAGAWTGGVAAISNLVVGMTLILVFPGRVPADSDVLRNAHTPQDILAGNIGEDLVGYIIALLFWPALGMILGILAGAVAAASRPDRIAIQD